MKKLKSSLSALFILFSTVTFSQNFIVLKNTSRINIDSILEITPPVVKYVTLGNIHEIEISSIKTIRQGNNDITFDEQGQPVYTALPEVKVVKQDSVETPAQDKANKESPNTQKPEPKKESHRNSAWDERPPGVNILFFPLSLIEPDAGVRLGLSTALSENSLIQADVSFLYRGLEEFGTVTNPGIFWGFAARLEYKNFFGSSSDGNYHPYAGPQLMIKYKSWTSTDSPAVVSKSTNTIFSANLKVGVIADITDRLFLDLYAGAGARFKVSSESLAPLNNTNTQGLPNFLLGIAIGLKLGGD